MNRFRNSRSHTGRWVFKWPQIVHFVPLLARHLNATEDIAAKMHSIARQKRLRLFRANLVGSNLLLGDPLHFHVHFECRRSRSRGQKWQALISNAISFPNAPKSLTAHNVPCSSACHRVDQGKESGTWGGREKRERGSRNRKSLLRRLRGDRRPAISFN